MEIDVIIATRNRGEIVNNLISEILTCIPLPNSIIVVDSSLEADKNLSLNSKIQYIKTDLQNQPYQRFLGLKFAKSEIVCFFDDDVNILDKSIFKEILYPYEKDEIVGSAVNIHYQSIIGNFELEKKNSILKNWLLRLTGVSSVDCGKLGPLGEVGKMPVFPTFVDYFYGPQMSFRKAVICNFNDYILFELYSRGIGKGEDKYLSYYASQFGKLFFNPKVFLFHPAIDSFYFKNQINFFKRTILSRKYLNLIWAKYNNISIWHANVSYFYYLIWRIIISIISLIIIPSKIKLNKTIGYISAVFFTEIKSDDLYWIQKLNDIKNNKI